MKHKILIINTLVGIFMAASALAYDGTGMWNYTETSKTNNCGEPNTLESGELGILQLGNTFIIIEGQDFSEQGIVDESTYTFSDTWCEGDGYVTQTATFNLSSHTYGTGTVYWTYTELGWGSCTGNHNFTISKQTQAAPVYDATGKWNFTQSGLVENCGDFPTPPASGYLNVTQTGNKITAVDNSNPPNEYKGFVNGSQYTVVRSYLLQGGGRTTEWGLVTLSSQTQGSGEVGFIWDDDCDECWGNWNISLTKEVTPSSDTTFLPFLMLLLE